VNTAALESHRSGEREPRVRLVVSHEYVGAILHPGVAKFYTCGGKI
jgi:hypothetical protein